MKIRSGASPIRRLVRGVSSRLFHWAENNGNCELDANGEAWLLRMLVARWAQTKSDDAGPRVVIDAGANRGDFTAAVLAATRSRGLAARTFAIDPAAACVDRLQQRFAGDTSVVVVRAAVGDVGGTMRLHSPVPGSTLASLVPRQEVKDAAAEEVAVIRLEDLWTQQQLSRVHLLKLDVEGYELPALRGLGGRLIPDSVQVVQFEYGGTTLDAGQRLRTFFELFEAHGYAVAKLFPHALEVRSYAPWMDHFSYANYVAIPATWIQETTLDFPVRQAAH